MEKRTYRITLTGEYYTKAAGNTVATVRPYKENFILPSLESALSVIKGKLLGSKLRQTHPDYETYRTHTVTNIQLVHGMVNRAVLNMAFSEMELLDLDDYCILHRLFCDVFAAKSLSSARAMVRERAQEQAERFNASAESRKAESEENKLRRLNNMNIKQHGVEIPGTAESEKKQKSKPAANSAPVQENKPPLVNTADLEPAPGESDSAPLPEFLADGGEESVTSESEG